MKRNIYHMSKLEKWLWWKKKEKPERISYENWLKMKGKTSKMKLHELSMLTQIISYNLFERFAFYRVFYQNES